MIRTWMQGAIGMGYLVVAMFFLSFWRETRDRFFLIFAAGFVVLTIHRTMFALTYNDGDWTSPTFMMRLAGYLVILGAIIDRRMRSA